MSRIHASLKESHLTTAAIGLPAFSSEPMSALIIRHSIKRRKEAVSDSELEDEVDKTSDSETETGAEAFEMVQTYGAVRPPPYSYSELESGPNSGSEQSALLGGERDTSRVVQRDGHASLASCISNLANTIMGTGAHAHVSIGEYH
ncbi:hypothetical protein C0995_008435 [Termitomyces sp. Mi166|nr:hypothetical protein C0995_008435 [Termitomyces sp. Mi166\